MKVNLGCGYKIISWYVNVDCVDGKGVDKMLDLDVYPWSFESDSLDEIFCDNILEHLDFDKSIREIRRILKVWGVAIIKVPYFSNPGAFFADHKCFFNYDSYNKFCWNIWSTTDIQEPFFDLVSRRITFLDEYKRWIIGVLLKIYYLLPRLVYLMSPRAYIRLLSYVFPASEIHWILKKI